MDDSNCSTNTWGRIYEKWNEWAFHVETNQKVETFLEPVIDKIPDYIKFKELWALVLLWLIIHGMSGLELVFECITRFEKRGYEERFYLYNLIKVRFRKLINNAWIKFSNGYNFLCKCSRCGNVWINEIEFNQTNDTLI